MGKSNKSTGRGLDHLIEQNSTELDFLSAYVGPEQVDSSEIISAMGRFCERKNYDFEVADSKIKFPFGSAEPLADGVAVIVKGDHLPLVPSDLVQVGFADGVLSKKRNSCEVVFLEWRNTQQRFLERIFEHFD